MADKAGAQQQPVISIRISEALRSRLERLKEVLSHKSGESISTSEVAKPLLESAREEPCGRLLSTLQFFRVG